MDAAQKSSIRTWAIIMIVYVIAAAVVLFLLWQVLVPAWPKASVFANVLITAAAAIACTAFGYFAGFYLLNAENMQKLATAIGGFVSGITVAKFEEWRNAIAATVNPEMSAVLGAIIVLGVGGLVVGIWAGANAKKQVEGVERGLVPEPGPSRGLLDITREAFR
ncbi:MAG: hypothetical protein H5T64_10265 [Chloroflexi bacterium]|nr:hypothetical protein [Chloroflexota bacterium]